MACVNLPAKQEWHEVKDFFRDPRIRHGIKFGLAGVLALFTALAMHLDSPSWAIITVMVLMLPQYLGGMIEKALFRMLGTFVGAMTGLFLVGNFVQDPFIFLSLTGLVVGYCTYRFGGTRFPYAFFLCGLTTVVVICSSLQTPERAWHYAITRMLEVMVGIGSSLLVSAVFWPLHATDDFKAKFADALGAIGQMTTDLISCLQANTASLEIDLQAGETIPGKINALQQVLHFGARESSRFRNRGIAYQNALQALHKTYLAALSASIPVATNTSLADLLSAELKNLQIAVQASYSAIERILVSDETSGSGPLPLRQALSRIEQRMEQLRESGQTKRLPIAEITHFTTFLLAMRELAIHLEQIGEALVNTRSNNRRAFREEAGPPTDRFWIYNGIKGGLVVALALFYVDWLQPPGATAIPMVAWVYVVMSRGYFHAQGDLRAFQLTIKTALWGIPVVLLLLLTVPLLSSYLLMNLFVFGFLFFFGYFTQSIPGVVFWMQCAILGFSSIVGLSPDHPVSFEQIMQSYFGLVVGMFFAAIIQRFLWPVLPQKELRHALVDYIAKILKQLTASQPDGASATSLLPRQAMGWKNSIQFPPSAAQDRSQLTRLIAVLELVGQRARAIRTVDSSKLPEKLKAELQSACQKADLQVEQTLTMIKTGFSMGRSEVFPLPDDSLFPQLEEHFRASNMLSELDFQTFQLTLGLIGRYESLMRLSKQAGELFQKLQLEKYSHDSFL